MHQTRRVNLKSSCDWCWGAVLEHFLEPEHLWGGQKSLVGRQMGTAEWTDITKERLKECISSSFIIIINIKTAVLFAMVLLLIT